MKKQILRCVAGLVCAALILASCGAEEAMKAKAESGDVEAQTELGMQYFEKGQKASHEGGEGAEYYIEAAKWLFRSLGQGDSMSLNLLYVIHQADDPEVQAFFKKSVSEYLAKAEAGDAEAQYLVGLMYLNGMGIGEDKVKAEEWIRKAADQGHQAAQQWVDEIPYYEK